MSESNTVTREECEEWIRDIESEMETPTLQCIRHVILRLARAHLGALVEIKELNTQAGNRLVRLNQIAGDLGRSSDAKALLESKLKQELLVSERLRLSWREDVETERVKIRELRSQVALLESQLASMGTMLTEERNLRDDFKSQLAEAQRDTERLDWWLANSYWMRGPDGYGKDPGKWRVYHEEHWISTGNSRREAIDAARNTGALRAKREQPLPPAESEDADTVPFMGGGD